MKITKRDVEMMSFINDCGFCNTPQLERRFLIKSKRVYQLMKRLAGKGLVYKEKIFFGEPNVYYLTSEGAEFTDLPAIQKISFGVYEHQIKLVDIAIRLLELYPNATWISERKLKHDNFFLGIGVRGHVSDGVLVFNENHKISIEVELTLKSKHRLESIFKSYNTQIAFKEVWYFCAPEVIPTLTKMTAKKTFIKIHSLKEYII